MEPTIVVDYRPESLLIHWLVLEKECPLDVVRQVPLDELKAPYYIAGDVLIYDHTTLVAFLHERYPGEQLMPPDPVSRAQIRQACTLIDDPSVDTFSEIEKVMDTGSPYLAGREFTMLDIYAGVWLSENYTLDLSSVRSYWNRLSGREAFRIAAK